MHLALIASAIVIGIAGYVCIFKSLSQQFQIQHELNAKLTPDQQLEPTFWIFETWQKFRRLQVELLPADPRPQTLRRFQIAGFVMLGTGILLILVSFNR